MLVKEEERTDTQVSQMKERLQFGAFEREENYHLLN